MSELTDQLQRIENKVDNLLDENNRLRRMLWAVVYQQPEHTVTVEQRMLDYANGPKPVLVVNEDPRGRSYIITAQEPT